MKYTKFVLSAIKERIFGKPTEPTEIPAKGKKGSLKKDKKVKVRKRKSDAIKWPKIKLGGMSSIMGVVTSIIMLVVGLQVFGAVSTSLNTVALGPGVGPLMNLVPLVLVAGVVIGLVTTVFRIAM
jgi:hypothetical protein